MRKTLSALLIGAAALLVGPSALASSRAHHPKPAKPINQRLLSARDLRGVWLVDRLKEPTSVSATACFAIQHHTPPHASVAFWDPTNFDRYGESIVHLPTDQQAQLFFFAKAHSLTTCDHFRVRANGLSASGFVEALSMPNVGAQSQAFQVQVMASGAGGPLTLTIHPFRVNSYVAESIESADDGTSINTSEQASFDTLAAKKLSS